MFYANYYNKIHKTVCTEWYMVVFHISEIISYKCHRECALGCQIQLQTYMIVLCAYLWGTALILKFFMQIQEMD